jgi:16S rRNA (uracil1498-N3)-methyltransferase
VERLDPPRVITFFSEEPVTIAEVRLSDAAAHHAQVRRLAVGEAVRLTDGRGNRGIGTLSAMSKTAAAVVIERVEAVPRPMAVHLFLPVADRDRMLWLAEKATELQVATWNPVSFRRSKSVSPRGEGDAFDRRVRARMISALEQSGGAWLPAIQSVQEVEALKPAGTALVLERGGRPLVAHRSSGPVCVLVGPEGGIESEEVRILEGTGWRTASLGDVTLRFETAAMAAIAIARSFTTPASQE